MKNIPNLKIEIALGLVIEYTLGRAYNINYKLYKIWTIILYKLHLIQ